MTPELRAAIYALTPDTVDAAAEDALVVRRDKACTRLTAQDTGEVAKLLAMGFPEEHCTAAVRRFPRVEDEVARIEYLLSGDLGMLCARASPHVCRRCA